jgi:predicted alpha/beta superfamily hydrolase
VGVGYHESRFRDALAPRQRDLTPTVSGAGGMPDDPAYMGGSSSFVTFLRDELKPWLSELSALRCRQPFLLAGQRSDLRL